MIRRPPRSTQSRSSAASDVYKRQVLCCAVVYTANSINTRNVSFINNNDIGDFIGLVGVAIVSISRDDNTTGGDAELDADVVGKICIGFNRAVNNDKGPVRWINRNRKSSGNKRRLVHIKPNWNLNQNFLTFAKCIVRVRCDFDVE
eukprot:TRINITY_DN28430_c0_g1_i1.p2 TRINITY_DN28430_c0_g1~~TRINITY_DN28430_c0_g1_i1.p2  ORF type:complete len:146 (+),score=18.77 TRINITY_DN28430_c0_g1_i1:77-514(+)